MSESNPYVKGDRVRRSESAHVGTVGLTAGRWVDVDWDNGDRGAYGFNELHEVPTATTRKPRTRSTTLTTAEELINGARAATYGDPAENFGRIADLWNAQFGHKLSAKFTASDVALALVHLKLSRLAVTPDHADSWIDGCGYLALGSELAT